MSVPLGAEVGPLGRRGGCGEVEEGGAGREGWRGEGGGGGGGKKRYRVGQETWLQEGML